MMFQATPKITPTLAGFCRDLSGHARLMKLPVGHDPAHQRQDCFATVAALATRSGGELVTGWIVWEWPRVLFEFAHHAVWKRPDGGFVDPNPAPAGVKRVLFLEDAKATFDPQFRRRRPSRYAAISRDPDVAVFIETALGLHTYPDNRCPDGMPRARDGSDPDFERLNGRHLEALHRLLLKFQRPGDRCHCGSGQKLYRCCKVAPDRDAFISARSPRITETMAPGTG